MVGWIKNYLFMESAARQHTLRHCERSAAIYDRWIAALRLP